MIIKYSPTRRNCVLVPVPGACPDRLLHFYFIFWAAFGGYSPDDVRTFDFPVTDREKDGKKPCRVKHEMRDCSFTENSGYAIKFNSRHKAIVTVAQGGNAFKDNLRGAPCAGVSF